MYFSKMFQRCPSSFKSIVFVLYLSLNAIAVVYAEQSDDTPTPDSEGRIMARVLQDALSQADLGKWTTSPTPVLSPFNETVSSEYVPTVGVIIKLHVGFPLSKPVEEAAGATPTSPAPPITDLWEKHEGRNVVKPMFIEKGITPRDGSPVEGDINVEIRNFGGGEGTGPGEASAAGPVFGTVAGPIALGDGAQPVNFMLTSPFEPPTYDAERVEKLRSSIISTIAKYGHRLSSLPNEERILVIVSGPVGRLDLLVSKVMAGAGGTQSGSSVREAVRTFTSSRGETDRLLISFPKSALMAESTPESLSGSLVQREYRSSADRPRFVRMGNSVSR